MRSLISRTCCGALSAIFVSGLASQASAADIRIGVSAKETYVGLPVTVQIQVNHASKIDPPVFPDVDGLEIKSFGSPGRSTQIMTINGRTTTTSSTTFAFQVTPQRAGSFRIPAFHVQADGKSLDVPALNLVASKSETGDLLFVEVAGKQKQIYVGQSLDLTLKIWVRPYHDRERNITLSEADMWRMLSERTNWGSFTDRLRELADNNQRPGGKEVLRKDRDGVEHSYYLYEIAATIYPKRPGKIDTNDVKVIVDYPTAIGKARDPLAGAFEDMQLPRGFNGLFNDDDFPSPFSARLTVQSVRPVVAEATVEPIDVLPIPTAHRPADYRGAVGEYQIVTEAKPSTVKAGDPINLVIGIVGTGPMELVQAPPLAELPELTGDFKVPNEPLAGYAKNDRKVFSTTIRPRKEGITQIPAIPFSYFDPHTQKFVTVRSRPISIHVDPAEMLALDAVVGKHSTPGKWPDAATSTKSGGLTPSLAIRTGGDLLRNESPATLLPVWLAIVLALPPIAVLGLLVTRSKQFVPRMTALFASGATRVRRQIEKGETATDICRALRTHLARQLGLNSSSNADAVVGALRLSGYRNLAVRAERLLFDDGMQRDAAVFNGPAKVASLKRDALQLVDDFHIERQQRRSRPTPAVRRKPATEKATPRVNATVNTIVAAMVVAGALFAGTDTASAATPPDRAAEFTTGQQTAILADANDLYNHALAAAGKDSADAKQAFADAAEKYQVLVDSGVTNGGLYFNLANVYLECGQKGKAIANYRRALRIDPSDREARTNLAFAETATLPAKSVKVDAKQWTWSDSSTAVVRSISQYAGPRVSSVLFVAAWCVLWLTIGLRIVGIRLPWKSTAFAAIVVALLAGSSYRFACAEFAQDAAVVRAPSVVLRTGDGESFAAIDGAQLAEGQSVEFVKQRGDWIQVRSGTGQVGWVPAATVEMISDRVTAEAQPIDQAARSGASHA